MIELPENLDVPWEPRTFAVGDRVRIRLSGECRVPGLNVDIHSGGVIGERPSSHLQGANGRTGTVIPQPGGRILDGAHRFVVRFDEPIVSGGWRYVAEAYAAIELLPLEATP